MRLSLKRKILLLLALLTAIPIALYIYHYTAMREKILKDRLEFNRLYAVSTVGRVELFLERVLSNTESLIYFYRNLGFSEEEILWRTTGQVKGVFEGAFYSPRGTLLAYASRERSRPDFESFRKFNGGERFLGIRYTEYKEPFLRFVIPYEEEGLHRGFFVFSLDLSLFWQSVVSLRPSADLGVFLTDPEGNVLAFSDMRFSSKRRIALREGIYRSEIMGLEVIGVFGRSEDGRWVVVVEEPVHTVLEPLQSFQKRALAAGSAFVVSGGFFAIFVFLRIFRPLEALKERVVSWERENLKKPIRADDEVSELSQAFESLVRRLEEERKLYSSLFENTLDGIIVFSARRTVIDVNRTVLERFRIKREELVGKPMKELIGEDLPMSDLFFSEKRVILGREVICELRQSILKIEGVSYILWRLRDVSQEKELEALLKHTAKLSLAGEIACSIAHQINNPLASIMGYAESILIDRPNGDVEKKAEVILRQARRCADTVKKLLDIGKPFEGEPSHVKPEETTIEAINVLGPKARKKGVSVELRSTLNGAEVFTFPWQLEQVLLNIIDNAIDASPEGGHVRIRLYQRGKAVVWRIEDDGPGIPESEIEKVFKPFYTTKEHGTGLGLSLARRFLKNMGGDIKIGRGEGGGTVVEIVLGEGEQGEGTRG